MLFSLIITAHGEGRLADKAMASALRATKKLEGEFEILINIDRGTAETVECLQKYANTEHCKIITSDFGDVGPARNQAASVARGQYLFFIDADDLISENFISETLKILETEEGAVVSPEFCISFEEEANRGAVLAMQNSTTRERDAYMLFSVNCWIIAIAGRREIFLEHPYIKTVDGYGHEDYALNIELASAGIRHLVAPNTVYYYRQRLSSRRKEHDMNFLTQPYSDLFEFEQWQRIENDTAELHGVKGLYVKLRQNRLVNALLSPLIESAKKVAGKGLATAGLPDAVLSEWAAMGKIEPKVAMKGKKFNAMGRFGVNPFCPASDAYRRLCSQITDYPDCVILTAQLDKQLQGSLDKIKTGGMVGRIAVITTSPSDDEVMIHEGLVDVIRFGDEEGLDQKQKQLLLTRLLVQLKTQKLIVLGDGYGKEWVSTHSELARTLGYSTSEDT